MANGTPPNFIPGPKPQFRPPLPGPKPMDPIRQRRVDALSIDELVNTLGNRDMQDQVKGLLQAATPYTNPEKEKKRMLVGLLSAEPTQELWKHKNQLDEWNAEIYPMLSEVEGGHQMRESDDGNYQGYKGRGKNWKSEGQGENVGTMHGITAMNLAEWDGIDPYTITVKMMKAITKEKASKIFKQKYYDRYGVGDIKKASFRKLAGVMTPLRNSAPGIVKKAEKDGETLDQTVRLVLEDYKKVGLKNYNEYIKGWVNRARKTAGMEPFRPEETLEDVYKEYPTLRRPAWEPPANWYAQ